MKSATDDSVEASRSAVAQLRGTKIFKDYENAFREATGLPIALRPIETFNLPHQGDPKENPFCSLMATTNQSCSACLQLQKKVEQEAKLEPKTLKCFAGLCDSAVPVRVGENLIAFLQTGQVLLHQPNKAEFARTTKQLLKWGTEVDLKRLEEAYFQTRVITTSQYESVLRLLAVFAQHLASLSGQLTAVKAANESPSMTKARLFITDHQSEELSLARVAGSVNMSAFYFCKVFKKATGLTFTAYLARVRVEKVKNLLLNPHCRVSEAAFAAGFQSLSQFNRIFREIAGEAPSAYKEKLHAK